MSDTAKVELQEFVKFDGSTTFAPAPTYRYSLSLKSGKLRIWIENCDSKEQRCTADLAFEEFVNLTNAIPNTSASDYVEFFHALLDSPADDPSEIPRTFTRIMDGLFRLELSMTIHVLLRSRATTYLFTLEPISMERIDVLESKLRDLQEEVKDLRDTTASLKETEVQETVKKLHQDLDGREVVLSELRDKMKSPRAGGNCLLIIRAEATRKFDAYTILWTEMENSGNVTTVDGVIRDLKPGTYLIGVTLTLASNGSICLVENDVCTHATMCDPITHISSLSVVTWIQKGNYLSVNCSRKLFGMGYLTLVRLGE